MAAELTTREWLERIEAQNARAAARGREVIEARPFRALLDLSTDLVWLNYAVPVASVEDSPAVRAALAALRRAFRGRNRTPRFEFTGDLWPGLAELLESDGYTLQMTNPTMLCFPADFRPVSAPGVAVRLLRPDDPDADLAAYERILHGGFADLSDAPPPTDADIARLRDRLARGDARHALATLDGVPAGVGTTAPLDGIAELGGVATLVEHRRRGVGATVSSYLMRDHFDTGGRVAWLSSADAARSVYERIGFRVVATRLNYIEPA